MGQVGTGSGPLIGLSLLFGAVCLSSGTALAVPVTEYITVQPIDVCGAVCAPVNNKGLTSVGAVGFIDPSGVNVTRAVWNQIGVDVTYMPTVRYVNGSFLTLPVDPNSNPLTSTAFKTLSQQDAISTGTVPNPSGGCDAACAANLMTTGLLRTQPTTSNPLGTLGTTTDQLNQMQQSQVLLSGFMNPIAGVSGTVSAPPTAAGRNFCRRDRSLYDVLSVSRIIRRPRQA